MLARPRAPRGQQESGQRRGARGRDRTPVSCASMRSCLSLSVVFLLASCEAAGDPDAGAIDAAVPRDAVVRDEATGEIDAPGALDARGELDATGADAPIHDAGLPTDASLSADASSGPAALCSGRHDPPDLSGVTLTRLDAVPIRDGFAPGWGIVEGPVWIGDALLVSHFGGGPTPDARLYRVLPDGMVSVARARAGTNGLALGPGDRLYGASHELGAIVAFDLSDLAAAPVTVAASYEGARFNGPNDLTLGSDGSIYFTDPDYQAPSPRPQRATRVYRRRPDGTIDVIADDLRQPNGVALSLDERTLFVGHASGLVAYPIDESGAVAGPRTSLDAIRGGVDGLGRDCAGDLYVTSGGAVIVLRPDGTQLGRLAAAGATNVAFGGPDRRTLYVTSLGDPPMLRSATLSVVGLPD